MVTTPLFRICTQEFPEELLCRICNPKDIIPVRTGFAYPDERSFQSRSYQNFMVYTTPAYIKIRVNPHLQSRERLLHSAF